MALVEEKAYAYYGNVTPARREFSGDLDPLSGVPAFKFSLETLVDWSAIGDNLKILVMAGACVVFPMFGNNVAIPPEYDGNREERLCIGRFGLTEQMCWLVNK